MLIIKPIYVNMKPPYFGYFDLDRNSKATTLDECLKECNGDLECFFPIEEFIYFYHDEDNFEAFSANENFRFFCPKEDNHGIYIYCGEAGEDKFTLSNGKQYYCYEWSDYIYPVKEEDNDNEQEGEIRLVDIIEEEFEYLSSEYPHLFKKLTLEELQELLIKSYPLIICIKKLN